MDRCDCRHRNSKHHFAFCPCSKFDSGSGGHHLLIRLLFPVFMADRQCRAANSSMSGREELAQSQGGKNEPSDSSSIDSPSDPDSETATPNDMPDFHHGK